MDRGHPQAPLINHRPPLPRHLRTTLTNNNVQPAAHFNQPLHILHPQRPQSRGQAFFVIPGGKGGGEILEEAGTFSGQALLLSYPTHRLVHSTYFESIPSKNLSLALALTLAHRLP